MATRPAESSGICPRCQCSVALLQNHQHGLTGWIPIRTWTLMSLDGLKVHLHCHHLRSHLRGECRFACQLHRLYRTLTPKQVQNTTTTNDLECQERHDNGATPTENNLTQNDEMTDDHLHPTHHNDRRTRSRKSYDWKYRSIGRVIRFQYALNAFGWVHRPQTRKPRETTHLSQGLDLLGHGHTLRHHAETTHRCFPCHQTRHRPKTRDNPLKRNHAAETVRYNHDDSITTMRLARKHKQHVRHQLHRLGKDVPVPTIHSTRTDELDRTGHRTTLTTTNGVLPSHR